MRYFAVFEGVPSDDGVSRIEWAVIESERESVALKSARHGSDGAAWIGIYRDLSDYVMGRLPLTSWQLPRRGA